MDSPRARRATTQDAPPPRPTRMPPSKEANATGRADKEAQVSPLPITGTTWKGGTGELPRAAPKSDQRPESPAAPVRVARRVANARR